MAYYALEKLSTSRFHLAYANIHVLPVVHTVKKNQWAWEKWQKKWMLSRLDLAESLKMDVIN